MRKLLYVCSVCAIAFAAVAPVSAQYAYYGFNYSDTAVASGGASYGYNSAIDEQTMKP